MKISNTRPAVVVAALIFSLTMLLIFSCRRSEKVQADARTEFFNRLKVLCGQTYEGYTDFIIRENDPFVGARLVMHIASCSDEEIRIPFHVNEDRSRTWILTRSDEGLLFKHDHRHADGTPEDLTMYGGWASDDGTALQQRFPADDYTAELLPEAAGNVWELTIDPDKQQFIYYLERDGEARFRAIIDLSLPVQEE